jgi:excisionase family DNA binding protein
MKSSEASELLGISASTVARMIQRGELDSRPDPRDRRVRLVDRAQVESLLAQIRGAHGEPDTG